ncbi:MAG: hypothetical protein P8Y44_03770, partial [Acidobacteriota bacterium]
NWTTVSRLALAVAWLGIAGSAVAGAATFSGTLTDRPDISDADLSGCAAGTRLQESYDLIPFIGDTTGDYTIETTAAMGFPAVSDDTLLALYDGTFAGGWSTNCIAVNDDSNGVLSSITTNLTAGQTYVALVTYAWQTGDNGIGATYDGQISGPGGVLFIEPFAGTLTDRPDILSASLFGCLAEGRLQESYDLIPFIVATSGTYTIETTAAAGFPNASDDTLLALFSPTFAGDWTTNCIAVNDDSTGFLSSITTALTAGQTYVAVVTYAWQGFGDGIGATFDGQISGPGRTTLGIFFDGFESGDTSAWSATAPGIVPRPGPVPKPALVRGPKTAH